MLPPPSFLIKQGKCLSVPLEIVQTIGVLPHIVAFQEAVEFVSSFKSE
jgi:hypothetical protein